MTGTIDSVVVIPARDEEQHISGCLRALAAQSVGRERFVVIVVADACVDATAAVAEAIAETLGLQLRVVHGVGAGAGSARRLGMDAAAALLQAEGATNGLIACTDADTRPQPDWLERQLDHVRAGARAIAGMIELDPDEAAALPGAVRRRRAREALSRLELVRRAAPDAAHHHMAGASLAVTVSAYLEVGRLEPLVALEDVAFGEKLEARGIPVLRAADVVVRTSARSNGRARRGLAVDLAVSSWAERRRFAATDYDLAGLLAAKRSRPDASTVTVIVPTRECAATIGEVLRQTVAPLRALVDEVVVIDAGSADGTAAAAHAALRGVRVLQQDELLPQFGKALGKGDAMWRAVHATSGEIVAFLDGDTADPDPAHLLGILGPLLAHPEIEFVKGTFERPLRAGSEHLAHEGGRVTELMARPLLNLHEPLLAGFTQPLAGEFAARRDLLESIPFPAGYGVEIATLIDALRRGGLDSLAESELGTRQNRHQSLRSLGEMSYAVLAAVERRTAGRSSPLGGHFLRPWDDYAMSFVPITERPPLRSFDRAEHRLAEPAPAAAGE